MYRNCNCSYDYHHSHCDHSEYPQNIQNTLENECNYQTQCNQYMNDNVDYQNNACSCGFEEAESLFPENLMYGHAYVPNQRLTKVFRPEVGLKMGTIFPELVSPYSPGQSMDVLDYLKCKNEIGEGCNANEL